MPECEHTEFREDCGICAWKRKRSERDRPGPLRKAVNYLGATARHLAAGRPAADPEEVARRLAVCRGCHEFAPADQACNKCGCPLADKAVRALSKCPLKKW